jgi:hypothetical protein
LLFCWGWFGALWGVAVFNFTIGEIEWWLLVLSACFGLYGLRPNLEKAIDSAWLGPKSTPAALAERAAQLKPVKRRIDIVFSLVVIALLLLSAVLWGNTLLTSNVRGS